MKTLFLSVLAFSAVFLSACGSLSSRGLVAASQLDPVTTPPADVALAITVPQTLQLADGDAVLRISYGDAARTIVDTEVPLTIAPATASVGIRAQLGDTLYVARVAEGDAEIFAAAQEEIRALRPTVQDGRGTLAIMVTGGCRTGPPLNALPVSTWFQTHPAAEFVPLTRQMDLSDELKKRGVTIPEC